MKSKKKNIELDGREVSIKLHKIQELLYKKDPDYDFDNIEDSSIEFGIARKFTPVRDKDIFNVELSLSLRDTENLVVIMQLRILVAFKILDMNNLFDEDGDEFTDKYNMVSYLFEISLGILRGVFFARTCGSQLEKYPLPLLPQDYLKSAEEESRSK